MKITSHSLQVSIQEGDWWLVLIWTKSSLPAFTLIDYGFDVMSINSSLVQGAEYRLSPMLLSKCII